MTELVTTKNWEDIFSLSKQRDSILKQYFSIIPIPDSKEVIYQIINDLKESDRLLTKIIKDSKHEMINQSLSLKHSQHAIQNYRTTEAGQ